MLRRIGVRAHDYGKGPIHEIASMIQKDGYGTIQLALKKVLDLPEGIDAVLNASGATGIYQALALKEIDIAVLGVYLNYAHPDEAIRQDNIDLFNDHIKANAYFKARMVATETGSLDSDYQSHPDNHGPLAFERFKDSVAKMLAVAEKEHVMVGVEAVAHHIIHTPKRMKALVDDLNHPNLKVLFDPVNIITKDNYLEQDALIHEMFDLLEDKIIVVHTKDFIMTEEGPVAVSPGEGLLHYKVLAQRVKASSQLIDVLAEDNPKAVLAQVHRFLEQQFIIS